VANLLIVLGALDVAGALEESLRAEGREPRKGPLDLGDAVVEQLSSAEPLDAFTWAPFDGGTIVRVQPRGEGGLEPSLPRALASAAGGLVLGLEVTRTRGRYLTGSFLAGRTVELTRCAEGVASGPCRGACDEDVTVGRFTAWTTALFGAAGAAPHALGGDAAGGILASPATVDVGAAETPVARIVVRGSPALERPDELDPLDVARRAADAGRPAAGVGLAGGGGGFAWGVAGADGTLRAGRGAGHDGLVAVMPRWALEATARGRSS